MKGACRVVVGATALVAGLVAVTVAVPLLAIARQRGAIYMAPTTPTGAAGIPPRTEAAYRAVDGWCTGLRWQLVAAIGAIESGHGTARGARTDPRSGVVSPPIFGPPLDGSPGVLALPIGSWVGWFGLPGPWQQAVGPMQFLPGTFTRWAVDADGDGLADPHDIDDAAATAANYLCGGGAVLDEAAAVYRYNHDDRYVQRVLGQAATIERATAGTPAPRR